MTDRGFYFRWFIGGIVVLLLVAGVCYLWYHYDTAPYRREAAKAEEFARQWEKDQKAKPKSTTAEQATNGTAAESDTQSAEKQGTDTTVTKDIEPTHGQTGASAENTETAEVRMSPYGFGPYPEIPEGFTENVITPIWIAIERSDRYESVDAADIRDFELIARVLIKVWQDDPDSRRYMEGGFYRNSKVYVNYSNRAYVRYGTVDLPDGTTHHFITSWTAGSLKAPVHDPTNPFQSNEDQIPSGVELIDLDREDPGIDPYSFLGL